MVLEQLDIHIKKKDSKTKWKPSTYAAYQTQK